VLRLAAADMFVLGRGFIALAMVVLLGVATAEYQMNDMTQRQSFVQVANIRRDEIAGVYSAYLLGSSYRLKAIYPVAGIRNTPQSVTLEAAGMRLTVPTVVSFDLQKMNYWLALWRRQFVSEAFETKRQLENYLLMLRPMLQEIINQIKSGRWKLPSIAE
jgi:hypothetical protein